MKKKQAASEVKPEPRKPGAEHLARIEMADRASLQAQAAVGRGFVQLLGLTQRAQNASDDLAQAHLKAAISVGIDADNPNAPWKWDAAARAYVKKD